MAVPFGSFLEAHDAPRGHFPLPHYAFDRGTSAGEGPVRENTTSKRPTPAPLGRIGHVTAVEIVPSLLVGAFTPQLTSLLEPSPALGRSGKPDKHGCTAREPHLVKLRRRAARKESGFAERDVDVGFSVGEAVHLDRAEGGSCAQSDEPLGIVPSASACVTFRLLSYLECKIRVALVASPT